MPLKEELKSKVCQEIDDRSKEIIGMAQAVLESPETGFREMKTSRLVAQKFTELGIAYRDGLAITGVKGVVQGGSDGPTVAVLGELDSLIVPDHPKADPQTGAAHACCHHTQIGVLIGVAVALTGSGVLPFLGGKVAFMAVPAEENIEIEFREKLRKEGKLSFLTGKPELIKLGEFDDVDMAMISHTTSAPEAKKMALGGTNNGMVAKYIQFIGRSAHAAVPHRGVNALDATNIALSAIHAQTFQGDVIVSSIITKGGELVSIVPADARMEASVRGKTIEAIKVASEKVDRALRAGALAVGAKVKITTFPAYSPYVLNPDLQELYRANAISLVGRDEVAQMGHCPGCSDMGDVSLIIPILHPCAGGATGTVHGIDFLVQDYQLAVLNPAKAAAMTVVDLLADGAAKGREVLSRDKPRMTKQEYLASMESLRSEEEYEG